MLTISDHKMQNACFPPQLTCRCFYIYTGFIPQAAPGPHPARTAPLPGLPLPLLRLAKAPSHAVALGTELAWVKPRGRAGEARG